MNLFIYSTSEGWRDNELHNERVNGLQGLSIRVPAWNNVEKPRKRNRETNSVLMLWKPNLFKTNF